MKVKGVQVALESGAGPGAQGQVCWAAVQLTARSVPSFPPLVLWSLAGCCQVWAGCCHSGRQEKQGVIIK